jgi:E-phenylitaconyl-CoA hydratase
MNVAMEVALACDVRIASNTASFALPEVKVGSIPAVGGIQRLLWFIPASIAMQMILTGDPCDAVVAGKVGLVSELAEPDDLLDRAFEIASKIASNAPLAVRAARLLAQKGLDMGIDQAMLLEQFVWGTLRDTEDRIEGRKAFAEKRSPNFHGR